MEQRGLLSLDLDRGLMEYGSSTRNLNLLDSGLVGIGTYIMEDPEAFRSINGYQHAHESLSKVLMDTLRDTRSPAQAVQAISTVIRLMQYYNSGYRWSVTSPATYVMFEEMSIPAQTIGLSTVVAMVATHLIVMGVTLVLFVQRTKATSLGNAWQSIAQVMSDDTLPILLQADDLKDKEVKEIIADVGEKVEMVGVVRRRQNGRNQFGPI